jgi:hypothetical protein
MINSELGSGDFGDFLYTHFEDGCSDLERSIGVLAAIEPDEDRRWKIVIRIAERVKQVLSRREVRPALDLLVEALLDTPTIEGAALDQLVATHVTPLRKHAPRLVLTQHPLRTRRARPGKAVGKVPRKAPARSR